MVNSIIKFGSHDKLIKEAVVNTYTVSKILEWGSFSTWYTQGHFLENASLYKQASFAYKNALKYNDKSSETYLRLALMNFKLHEINSATSNVVCSYSLNPFNFIDHYLSIGDLVKHQDLEEFHKYLNISIQNDTVTKLAKAILCYLMKNNELAIKYLDEIDDPQKEFTGLSHKLKGDILLLSSDYQNAISKYEKAIDFLPLSSSTYYLLGVCYQSLGEFSKCYHLLNQAIELFLHHENVYCRRGDVRFILGDFNGSINDYTQAIAINPKFHFAFVNRSTVLCKLGRLSDALEDISVAIKIEPNNELFYTNRSLIREQLGDFKGATIDKLTAQHIKTKLVFDATY